MRTPLRSILILAPVAILGAGLTFAVARAQHDAPGAAPVTAPASPAKPAEAPAENARGNMQAIGAQLIAGLKATPGCLGTEVAQTMSGKSVIFGWFENKKAALAWYNSPIHQELMNTFFPERKHDHIPLANIPDDSGPIMALASLSIAKAPQVEGSKMPLSQIAIELYSPLPAGITVNGSFSPEALKVPGRTDIRNTQKDAAPAKP